MRPLKVRATLYNINSTHESNVRSSTDYTIDMEPTLIKFYSTRLLKHCLYKKGNVALVDKI